MKTIAALVLSLIATQSTFALETWHTCNLPEHVSCQTVRRDGSVCGERALGCRKTVYASFKYSTQPGNSQKSCWHMFGVPEDEQECNSRVIKESISSTELCVTGSIGHLEILKKAIEKNDSMIDSSSASKLFKELQDQRHSSKP